MSSSMCTGHVSAGLVGDLRCLGNWGHAHRGIGVVSCGWAVK